MKLFLLDAPAAGGFDMSIILLMMGIFLVVQFVIIGPKQKKKEKEMRQYIDNLSQGDKVVITPGIHGKYLKTDGPVMIIEVDSGVKLKVDPAAISYELTKAINKPAEAKS